MGIEEAMAFIHHTGWMGSKLGLVRMTELLHRLGDPQTHLRFVHVAGTNGKGSVCAMLSSVLTNAGYKTGLYTSPHLVRINERFVIDGVEISDARLCEIAEQTKRAIDDMAEHPTEFEILTTMALLYFYLEGCDIVVLEVGLGGRLDATNVIPRPDVAVIMNIGLEHTDVLGDTLEKIAFEKGGIIKEHSVAVSYNAGDSVAEVLRTICAKHCAVLYETDFAALRPHEQRLDGQRFDFGAYRDLRLPLLGMHQLKNAAVALTVIDHLQEQGWCIDENAVRSGLAKAEWPARFEVLSHEPPFILDGAHNPQCVDTLIDGLQLLLPEPKVVFLLGVLADKDYPAMLRKIVPYAKRVVCLTPDSPRALPAEKLAAYLCDLGVDAVAYRDVSDGIAAATEAAEGVPVVAFGSLYLAGEIREAFLSVCHTRQGEMPLVARKRIDSYTAQLL